ncbi:MAG: translocation/assembly module TamB domain-containing protein [Bacillota bacterium]
MELKFLKSKKVIIGLSLVFILLIGLYFNINRILLESKESIITKLESNLNTKIEVEELIVSGINKISAKDVVIKDQSSKDLIKAHELVINYSIIDLLFNHSKPLEVIRDIELNSPTINLVQQDKWNYSFLLSSNGASNDAKNDLFSIHINNGLAEIETPKLTEKITEIDGIIDLNKDIGVFLDGQLEDLKADFKTDLIIEKNKYRGEVEFSNLSLDNLTDESYLNLPSDLDLGGLMAGKVKLNGQLNQQNDFYGDLSLQNGSLDYQDVNLDNISGALEVDDYGINIEQLIGQYKDNSVKIKGDIYGWEEPQLNLDYELSDFQLAAVDDFVSEPIGASGQAEITGQIKGTLLDPTVWSVVEIPEAKAKGVTMEDIRAKLYYKDQVLNLEQVDLAYQQGMLELDGNFDFSDSLNYIINTKFNNIAISDIEQNFLDDLDLTGTASGESIISGTGLSADDLNVLGSLKLDSGAIKAYDFEKISTKFWLNNSKLFLNNTQFRGSESEGSANGLINLDGNLDLDIKLNNLDLEKLEQVHQLDKLSGQVDLAGELSGQLSDPQLIADVTTTNLDYDQNEIGSTTAILNITNEQVQFRESSIPKYSSELTGVIDFANQKSNLKLETAGLEAKKISELIAPDLSLTGDLSATTEIDSIFSNPQLSSDLEVTTGVIGEQQKFDQLDLKLNYDQQQEELNLASGNISYGDSQLSLSGTMVEEELNFKFDSSNLVWEDINYTTRLEELVGSAQLSGSIYGDLNNPKVASKFNTHNLEFAEKSIGDLNGRLDYKNNNLYLTDIKVTSGDNKYQVNGNLDLEQNQIKQVKVKVEEGTVDYLNQFHPLPLNLAYDFSGQIEVNGAIEEPYFDVELAVEDNDGEGRLEVMGDYWWQKNSDLELMATNFDLDFLNKLDLLPYQVTGNLNLTGHLTGELTNPNIKSELKVTTGEIANLNYKSLTGNIELINGEKIIVDQRLQVEGDNVVQAQGEIPVSDDEKFDFNLDLQEGNLSILPLLVPEIETATGKGNANLQIEGTLQEPQIVGAAEVVAGSFSYPVLDREINNLNGKIKFRNDKLLLEDLTGYYGVGNFSGQGSISLDGLALGDYNLDIAGEKIAFEHGSWQGLNDADIKIRGSKLRPEITGEIIAYDTRFNLPVNWPKFGSGGDSKIEPQLDLTVKPEENVKVANDQINILVQRGDLNLETIDDQIRIIGELKSNTGRFTYYNTEFELEEGTAVFRQHNYIPSLQLEAKTEIYDKSIAQNDNNLASPYHNLYLNLTGPANKLNYQLSSDSSLSEEEIIALLTGQGGIGSLLEKDYEQALTSELRRVIGEGIKTEVIYKVERSFEESLDLDQVRIKSLLEDNDSIEVELGKFIFDDFMLKYNHSFLEENKKIGFEYYFNQGLDNLMIQGNYDSLGEYELGLEASIPF